MKKKTVSEIREEIGVSFPKGFAEANYNMESYLHNRIDKLTEENMKLALQLSVSESNRKYAEQEYDGLHHNLTKANEKIKLYERALAAYGDPKGIHILRAVDKGWDNESN